MGRSERGAVLGELESEVMGVLWQAGEAMPVRAVLAELNQTRDTPLAYTTVMTVLSRLTDRGVLRRQRAGRGYAYRAVLGSQADIAVRELLDDFGDAALASFVEQVGDDEWFRQRLRRLVGGS